MNEYSNPLLMSRHTTVTHVFISYLYRIPFSMAEFIAIYVYVVIYIDICVCVMCTHGQYCLMYIEN